MHFLNKEEIMKKIEDLVTENEKVEIVIEAFGLTIRQEAIPVDFVKSDNTAEIWFIGGPLLTVRVGEKNFVLKDKETDREVLSLVYGENVKLSLCPVCS